MALGNSASEERQGKALIDETVKQSVKFFVYSSVDRTNSFENPTKVPHFINKHNIEHHLVDKSKNTEIQWTILRPTAFYENVVPGFFGKVFMTSYDMALKGKPLQMVGMSDIGYFAADALLKPGEYKGQAVSLAGDELTYEQVKQVFEEKTGQSVPWTFRFLCSMFMASMKDMGYKANILELKKVHPGLKDFGTWLKTESEFETR